MSAGSAATGIIRGIGLAVITGGSSGIGERFITTIQEANPEVRICNLSRRAPGALNGVHHEPCDLANPENRRAAFARVSAWMAARPEAGKLLLINNSGFGTVGAFPEPKTREHVEMIEVNVAAMVELTGELLPALRSRGGAIINVASTAAFQPMPDMQTYAATKAFVVSWSVALAHELRGSGIRVQALCPGPTRTGFGRRAGHHGRVSGRISMTPEAVVDASLRALARDRVVVVPGVFNRMVAWIARRVPLGLAAALANRALDRSLDARGPERVDGDA